MLMDSIDLELFKNILGYTATGFRIILFLPQIYHVYSRRDASGLSIYFLVIGLILSIISTGYGALLEELPIVIASSFAFCSVIALLVAKCLFPKKTGYTSSDQTAHDNAVEMQP